MEPFRVVSTPHVPTSAGELWNDHHIVYDGLGLEDEPTPVDFHVPCAGCGQTIGFDLRTMLESFVGREPPTWMAAALHRMGFAPPHRVPFGPSHLDLALMRAECGACRRSHAAVGGYTEFQPARYLGSIEAVAAVESLESLESADAPRWQSAAVAVAMLSVVFLVGGLVWSHWSVYRSWRTASDLAESGVAVEADVLAADESHGPRSVDSYRLTVRFDPGTGSPVVDEIDVDVATYTVATIADRTTVLYDPNRPDRYDIEGNDQHGLDAFILGVVDLALLAAGVVVVRKARRVALED
jgi:hypothetical protein